MPTLYGSFCRVDLADGVIVAMADSTTVRVVPAPDASTRADLADDVARLERAVADLTRAAEADRRLALHTAGERDRAISELGVTRGERERLRAQLEAAHRAAREGVDLRVWVRRSDVLRLCEREELDALIEQLRADRAGQRQREVLATPEGALGATMQRATTMLSGGIGALLDGHVSPSERADLRPELAALATMIRRTLRAWDAADAGAEVLPLKRTGAAR
jgi:hypothetical protein